ncbi:unnamed protein product [Ectocarpus sp. 12 AP-2014]
MVALPRVSGHTGPSELSAIQPPTFALDPDITLEVGPTLLFESGQWVTVSWSGIESWMFPDAFVAAFSPGTALDDPATVTEVAPIKYQFLTAEEPFPGVGHEAETGVVESLRFRLLNLRDAEGYRFGLFKGGVEEPVLVARTAEAVTFAQPFEVLHLHLALTSDMDSMRVSWVTGEASQAPAVIFREVAVGAQEGVTEIQVGPWQEVTAESSITYGREDMCGEPATSKGFHNPGLLHSAVLPGLIPGHPYEYKAGDSDAQEWGSSSYFYAPPVASGTTGAHQRRAGSPEQPSSAGAASPPPLVNTVAASGDASARDMSGKGSRQEMAASAPSELDNASGIGAEGIAWDSDAVKVAVFGDMGTAELDGTLDAGHTSEPPSIRTVSILNDHLRGGAGVGAVGSSGDGDRGSTDPTGGGKEPQLGLVLHIGDLSYARGYDAQWDEYMDQIKHVASAVPWMVGVGNHERDYPTTSESRVRQELSFFTGTDSGGDCGVPTAFRFIMPGAAEEPMADSPWYGFDFGPVHFTVMSTEHNFSVGSKQYAFIKEDLAGVDRAKTPWIVFAGHRPMYVNSGGAGAGECEGAAALEPNCANDQPVARSLRSALEPLLLEHQVDLAVYGHHHSYQRTCRVANETCVGPSSRSYSSQYQEYEDYIAPVHVVMGMAGMGLSQNMVSPKPEWVEYATDREFGLGMIVADSSKLQLSFILDADGQVGDEVVLVRPPPPSTSAVEEDGTPVEGAEYFRGYAHEKRDHARNKEILKAIGEGNMRRSKRVTG